MAGLRPAEPSLFAVGPGGAPVIHGASCRSCGHVFFPAQDYGCERCGARTEELDSVDLPTSGRVLASTTVNFGPGVAAGTVLGTIALDGGPAIQAIFAPSAEAHRIEPGTRVRAVLVARDGKDLADLRFEVSGRATADVAKGSGDGPQPV